MASLSIKTVEQYYETGFFSAIDINFARFITKLAGTAGPELFLAAALVSRHTAAGHVCLDIADTAGGPLIDPKEEMQPLVCPDRASWLGALEASPVVGSPGDYKPLILDPSSRLYLYRYWQYEQKLAAALIKRADDQTLPDNTKQLEEIFCRLFPDDAPGAGRQKCAACVCLLKNFALICGGPGTGKTTTVAKILALFLELGLDEYVIALAAPTGKAAARLQNAIMAAKETLPCPDRIKAAIPTAALTLHRLLKAVPGSAYFYYNAANPLPADIIVIDEASMVDVPMLAKLVEAARPETKIILIGDKDQLASVESGAAFGDICAATEIFSPGFRELYEDILTGRTDAEPRPGTVAPLHDCVVELRESYRFAPHSGIGALSSAVRQGDTGRVISILHNSGFPDISWPETTAPRNSAPVRSMILEGFGSCADASTPGEAFMRFERFRILCALREGPLGVSGLNQLAEKTLSERNLIHPAGRWYHGRPIMITRNDYGLNLFNGDVGLVLRDPDNRSAFRAYFPGPDGTVRAYIPEGLPDHETVFAMTVHKSQGSEFDSVLIVLPDNASPVLTRELLYTGITRAKQHVSLMGSEDIIEFAVSRSIRRTSGLREALFHIKSCPIPGK